MTDSDNPDVNEGDQLPDEPYMAAFEKRFDQVKSHGCNIAISNQGIVISGGIQVTDIGAVVELRQELGEVKAALSIGGLDITDQWSLRSLDTRANNELDSVLANLHEAVVEMGGNLVFENYEATAHFGALNKLPSTKVLTSVSARLVPDLALILDVPNLQARDLAVWGNVGNTKKLHGKARVVLPNSLAGVQFNNSPLATNSEEVRARFEAEQRRRYRAEARKSTSRKQPPQRSPRK